MSIPPPVTFFAVVTLAGAPSGGQTPNLNVVAIYSASQGSAADQKASSMSAANPNRHFYVVKAIMAFTSGITNPVLTMLS